MHARSVETPGRAGAGVLPDLRPLEIASGVIVGESSVAVELDDGPTTPSMPREALARLLLEPLSRPPCLVAFSGGRDSSAILATAADLARRHGLYDPVPVTLRYPDDPRTQEDEWQELVVRHLGLSGWQKISVTTEYDAVGPGAAAVLRRHGLYWPGNAHGMVPLLDAAQGGSLVTGNGGDEVFSPWGWRRPRLRGERRSRLNRRARRRAALALLPLSLRAAVWRRRRPLRLGWLTDSASTEVDKRYARAAMRRPSKWADDVDALLTSRYLELADGIFMAMAAEAGALLSQPFLHKDFARAMAARAPRDGFSTRSAAMRESFADLLPDRVLTRTSKASFTGSLWGPESRAFVREWGGEGVDEALVQPDLLRREWEQPRPDFRTITLLQSAWLAADGQACSATSAST
jgi:asparagine synthase (glutamine-hydrolysing)